MVLLASAIVSKTNGKILLSRQFVEMTRSRIEGLLTAFSKLITKDKQHTFIETDSVRYVYQALMDRLYCVMITTKSSNILEDLETLRLFVRVVNEYTTTPGKSLTDEQAIMDKAFTLIFAFDEIVALGYRESVNMSQVRTFIEMDSHEERVYTAVRQTQERDAKQTMREKVKEMSKMQRTQQLGSRYGGSGGGGISMSSSTVAAINDIPEPIIGDRAMGAIPSSVKSMPSRPSKALKLGSKLGTNSFFSAAKGEQLDNELKKENVASNVTTASTNIPDDPVVVMIEEKLKCEVSRDGGIVRTCELSGMMQVIVRDEGFANIKIAVECEDDTVQIQTHPNVDKELFKSQHLIALKQKSFPIASMVGVLKYRRITTSGDDWPPLVITAWPNGNNCNLELQINRPLHDITIQIPCPSQPIINECNEGEYEWKRKVLKWSLSFLTMDSPTATIDFDLSEAVSNDDFFPISCSFQTDSNLARIKVVEIQSEPGENDEIKWSADTKLVVEKYEIA